MMPIRESEKARYPKDWKAISKRIRHMAGDKCQNCAAPNGELIRRGVSYAGTALWRRASASAYENGFHADYGHEIPDTGEDTVGWHRPVKVVLTVAHLDHTPENCADDNLRAWCQRCHLRYDADHHRRNSQTTRHAKRASGDLMGDE